MKFLTRICQDDVITSSDDVLSRNKLHTHVRDKFVWKVSRGGLENCYGSEVIQQKVGLGWIYPSPLSSMRVNLRLFRVNPLRWPSTTEVFLMLILKIILVGNVGVFEQFSDAEPKKATIRARAVWAYRRLGGIDTQRWIFKILCTCVPSCAHFELWFCGDGLVSDRVDIICMEEHMLGLALQGSQSSAVVV